MDETDQKQITAKAKCGGLSTAAAKCPPPVEMTVFWGERGRTDNGNSNDKSRSFDSSGKSAAFAQDDTSWLSSG